MKTTIWKNALIAFFVSGLVSCNVLDLDPLDTYTEAIVFSDPVLTDAYVTENYVLPECGFNWSPQALRFLCDEAMCNFGWYSLHAINGGGLNPEMLNGLDIWSNYYRYIKNCNIFFDNMDKVQTMDQATQDLLIGEMRFFRAYYYMGLVSRFGGVPLITRPFELDDPDMLIPRDSYEKCLEFILDEFQQAADLLPVRHSGGKFGRITKGAALSMKARMLLYAASPLWNPSNDKAKWQAAADAAKAVIDLNVYSLDADYKGLFLNMHSKEIIFQRLYTTEFGHWFDAENTPNGWGGYSAVCVLQEMVDSYEMEDGTMPDPSIYATATSNPWAGRDPRFYASIVCDGQTFKDGTAEFWVSEDGSSGGKDSEMGRDAWNYPKTHYTLRKFMDESNRGGWYTKGNQPWIFCRLAEVYLNYAEAMYHVGNEAEARKYVNLIRERARGGRTGIVPDITESGDALLKRIQHERKIELAFEEHRFYDVRRWKIAEQTDNGPVHGIQITRKANGDKSYEFIQVQNRKFIAPNHYLVPIPQYEIRKNDLLEQNPGYTK